MIAGSPCSGCDDQQLVVTTVCRPVQCTEEPACYQQHSSLVLVNSQQRKVGSGQDKDDNSSVPIPLFMDDETWNAQIVKYTNEILMALPYLDYNSEKVAKCLDQIQRDVCVLLGEEVLHSFDTPCGQDHH